MRDKLGADTDIEALAKEINEGKESSNALYDEFYTELKKGDHGKEVDNVTHTINDAADLIYWQHGDTIHPAVEKGITMIKKFVEQMLDEEKEYFEHFQHMAEKDKMRKLIQSNRYFYIHKRVWDEISERIHDAHLVNRILGVLSIQADEINVNQLCKNIINNQDLFRSYIL